MEDRNMRHVGKFKSVKKPWRIPARLDRMRYLLSHFAWHGSMCHGTTDQGWMVARSSDGKLIIPIWPNGECLRRVMGETFTNCGAEIVTLDNLEADFLGNIYDDELIGVFPDLNHEYEVLTVAEFRNALEYALLIRDVHNQPDTVENSRISKFFKLTPRK